MRAILRAGVFGKIRMMFPMVSCMDELNKLLKLLDEVRSDLKNSNMKFDGSMDIGVMIEIPSAALIADKLAKQVDFFSIGTNDLTQYTLAIDRQNQSLDAFFDAHHIAVLRMIYQTVQNAHKAGIWCGICGELGADSDLTELFLAMGIDELSVSPGRLLTIRRLICETDSSANKEEILKKWL